MDCGKDGFDEFVDALRMTEEKEDRERERRSRPDDYVLMKRRIHYAPAGTWLDELPGQSGERPEFEVEVWRVMRGAFDKRGEFCEDYTVCAADYGDSPAKGSFGSLEEAKLAPAAQGWTLADATSDFKRPGGREYLGRSVVKVFRITGRGI